MLFYAPTVHTTRRGTQRDAERLNVGVLAVLVRANGCAWLIARAGRVEYVAQPALGRTGKPLYGTLGQVLTEVGL